MVGIHGLREPLSQLMSERIGKVGRVERYAGRVHQH